MRRQRHESITSHPPNPSDQHGAYQNSACTTNRQLENLNQTPKAPTTTLTELFSSVKNVLKDNVNACNLLDFSKRIEPQARKQQLRYHVNTHDSEQSMLGDNAFCLGSSENLSNHQATPSNLTKGGIPFDYGARRMAGVNLGMLNIPTTSSQQSLHQNNNEGEGFANGSSSERGDETQRAVQVQDETEAVEIVQSPPKMHTMEPLNISSPPDRVSSVRQSQSRFFHTFNNEEQKIAAALAANLLGGARDSLSMRKSLNQFLHNGGAQFLTGDPATPIFSCSKQHPGMTAPNVGIFQSMHFSTGDCGSNQNCLYPKDPQIISKTGFGFGLMRLNSSSSCASLDHQRQNNSLRNSRSNLENEGQVFNQTIIQPPNLNEELNAFSPSVMVKNSYNQSGKPRGTVIQSSGPAVKKKPQSAACNFSKTQRLANGNNFNSHQQSPYIQMSRVLSPKSNQSQTSSGVYTSGGLPIKQIKATKRHQSTSLARVTARPQTVIHNKTSNRSSISFSGASSSFQAPTSSSFILPGVGASSLAKKKKKQSSSFLGGGASTIITTSQANSRCASKLSYTTTTTTVRRVVSPPQGSTSIAAKKPIYHTTNQKKTTTNLAKSSNPSRSNSRTSNRLGYQTYQQQLQTFTTTFGGGPLQTLTSYPSQVTINSQLTTNVKGKSHIILKGLQQRGQAITDKNESVNKLLEEKRQYQLVVMQLKKEVAQTQKSSKVTRDSNRQITDDIDKLAQLVHLKADRNSHISRDIANAKKDIRNLQVDCETLRQDKDKLTLKLEGEYHLIDAVQRLIVNLKKQIYDVRKDKERLQISIKGDQRKQIEVINKRRAMVNEESDKIYYDFNQTMNQTNVIGNQSMMQSQHTSRSNMTPRLAQR